MWIFLNDAALSIVAWRFNRNWLLVRARVRGDIEAVFPLAKVKETPDADYAYRALIPRHRVGAVIAQRLEEIDYDNFKDSCPPARHRAYMGLWAEWDDAASRLDGKASR